MSLHVRTVDRAFSVNCLNNTFGDYDRGGATKMFRRRGPYYFYVCDMSGTPALTRVGAMAGPWRGEQGPARCHHLPSHAPGCRQHHHSVKDNAALHTRF
jgi:hypothetical protein